MICSKFCDGLGDAMVLHQYNAAQILKPAHRNMIHRIREMVLVLQQYSSNLKPSFVSGDGNYIPSTLRCLLTPE